MGKADTFDTSAAQYDAWYNTPKGKAILATEVRCLKPLLGHLARPYLEIGVGSARFSSALRIEYGLDPSFHALEIAAARKVEVCQGTGEKLPFRDSSFGAVLIAFTLCFVQDTFQVLLEARRVLKPGGGMVLGLLLKGTPWADLYARQGEAGHPIYKLAYFHTKAEIEAFLKKAGFNNIVYMATLFQPPDLEAYKIESPKDGYDKNAGVIALSVVRVG